MLSQNSAVVPDEREADGALNGNTEHAITKQAASVLKPKGEKARYNGRYKGLIIISRLIGMMNGHIELSLSSSVANSLT